MFIVWGRKAVYRHLGYVADFCPICRSAQPFSMKRIGMASHVYYITVGDGDLVGHERTCMTCDTLLNGDPDTYATISNRKLPLRDLKRLTNPHYDEVFKERIALEEVVKNDPASLSPADRQALIRLPFVLLAPKFERRFASTHIDKEIGLAIISALILLVVGPTITHLIFPTDEGTGVLIFLFIGLGLILWQGMKASRRYALRVMVPTLAKTLRPLAPTDSELLRALNEQAQQGNRIGKKIKVADLRAQLRPPVRAAQAQASSVESES